MPTITVTAPDSAMAMDEVIRQLGSDAYILSTSQFDGLVQIKATIDPMTPIPRRSNAVQTVFEEEFEKQFEPSKRLQTPIVETDLQTYQTEQPKLFSVEGGLKNSQNKGLAPNDEKMPALILKSAVHRVEPSLNLSSTVQLEEVDSNSIETRLARIESMLDLVQKTAPVVKGLVPTIDDFKYQNMVDLGFEGVHVDAAILNCTKNGHPVVQSNLIRHLADQVVSSELQKTINADVIVIMGPSGAGKTTLAAKFATLLGDMIGDRQIELVSLDGVASPQNGLLNHYCQQLSLPMNNWPVDQENMWTPIGKDKLHIIDVACTTENAIQIWPQLQEHFQNQRVHIVVALPSGLTPKRIENELVKTDDLIVEVVMTKLDECECSVPEISQLLTSSAKVGWFAGTCDLEGNLVKASTAIMEQYLQGYFADVPKEEGAIKLDYGS